MWLPLLVAAAFAGEPAVDPPSPSDAQGPAEPAAPRGPTRHPAVPARFFAGVVPPPTGSVVCEDGRCRVAPPLGWTARDAAWRPSPSLRGPGLTVATLAAALLAASNEGPDPVGGELLSSAILYAASGQETGQTATDPHPYRLYPSYDQRRWDELAK